MSFERPAFGTMVMPWALALLAANPPTALLMLELFGRLQPGDWVIQNSANSSVGVSLIQNRDVEGYFSFIWFAGFISFALGLTNLLPLPALDGGRIVVSLLPHRLAWRFAQIEPYGFIILLALLYLRILGSILTPLIYLSLAAIAAVCGVPQAGLFQLINLLQ